MNNAERTVLWGALMAMDDLRPKIQLTLFADTFSDEKDFVKLDFEVTQEYDDNNYFTYCRASVILPDDFYSNFKFYFETYKDSSLIKRIYERYELEEGDTELDETEVVDIITDYQYDYDVASINVDTFHLIKNKKDEPSYTVGDLLEVIAHTKPKDSNDLVTYLKKEGYI